MKMNGKNIGFVVLTGCAVFLAAYYAAGLYVPVPGAPTGAWPVLGAAAVILVNGFGLLVTSNRISVKATVSVPLIYVALVTANPWALRWSDFHPASLLFLGAIFCYLLFCTLRPSLELLAGCFFLLGASGLFIPPLLWLFPVFLLMGIGRTPRKAKYLVTAVLSLCVPLVIQGSIVYLRQDVDTALELLPQLWAGMTTIHPAIRPFPAVTLARILFVLAVTLVAVLHVIHHLNTYKTVQFLAFIRLIGLATSLSIMALIFPSSVHTPCGLIICLPVTLLLNDFIIAPGHRRGKVALAVAAVLLFSAERVFQLL